MRTQSMLLSAGAMLLAARYVQRRLRHYDLPGKTALITGGSRGLGLVLAREFGKGGCKVAICSRGPAELDRAEADLKERGIRVLPVLCDVTSPEMAESAVAEIRHRFGPVDILVNNAGTIAVGPSEVMTAQDYQDSLNVHFWGPYHLTQAVLPDMKQRQHGRIVNISSFGGMISVVLPGRS